MMQPLLFVLFALVVACSSDGGRAAPDGDDNPSGRDGAALDPDGPSVGAADAGGDGLADAARLHDAAAGDAASADAAASAPGDVSAWRACTDYLAAGCERAYRCGVASSVSSCMESRGLCPELYFAPGSTRTATSLQACAAAWASLSCSEVAEGRSPPCASAGTRAVGEGCAYAAQCSTMRCGTGRMFCGVCLAPAALGQACERRNDCVLGATCLGTTCFASEPRGEAGPKREDEACTSSGCDPYLACVSDPSSSTGKRCRPAVLGAPCKSGKDCPRDAWCGDDTCVPLPRVGDDCSKSAMTYYAMTPCEAGAYCGAEHKCVPRLPLGSADCTNYAGRDGCLEGLICHSECRHKRLERESCAEPLDGCEAGTHCEQGTCVGNPNDDSLTAGCKP